MLNRQNHPPIFIIGQQRSGTTLLRMLLNSHSMIAIPQEGVFWLPLLRKYEKKKNQILSAIELNSFYKYLERNELFRLWEINLDNARDAFEFGQGGYTFADFMASIYSYNSKLKGKKIWGDKTPPFFNFIPNLYTLFPNAKFIHIVRDGRDLYLSRKKFDSTKRYITVAAIEWRYKEKRIRSGLKILDKKNYFETKYEDLVDSPEKILNEICQFLDLNFETGMLKFYKQSKKNIVPYHSDLIFRPVSKSSVEKWKNELTTQEIKIYEMIAGDTLSSLNYELLNDHSGFLISYVHIIAQLSYALPLRVVERIFQILKQNISIINP